MRHGATGARGRTTLPGTAPRSSGWVSAEMLQLIGLVVSIGLADSLNPTTVGPALYLAAGNRPRRSVIRFTLAVFVVNLLGGLVLTLGPGEAILALVPRPGATVRYILETAA